MWHRRPTTGAVVSDSRKNSSGFDFDFPDPPTEVKPQSVDDKWEGSGTCISGHTKGLPRSGSISCASLGPFELQADDKEKRPTSEECAPDRGDVRVDSARASASSNGEVTEPNWALSQVRRSQGTLLTPVHPDGASQAMSAYSYMRRALESGSTHSLMIDILSKVQLHRRILDDSYSAIAELDEQYLSSVPHARIELAEPMTCQLRSNVRTVLTDTQPSVKNIFNKAEQSGQNTIFTQAYPNFVRMQMTLAASETSSGDIHRYKGLGDCFCLTQPSQADNPIVFASDGFVAVAGYQRREVMPRNCRFLQGQDTDRASVDRIRHCIKTEQESVEFLLNYRKNGEPFWNLLYTAPLLDSAGKFSFHIGGQVNCSSSIQGKPDIMKILAISPDHESQAEREHLSERKSHDTPASELARRVEHLKSLRYRQKADVAPEPGIERELIEVNQDTPLSNRIENFYSAYSKYLVIGYPSLTIHFSSAGISSLLLPTGPNAASSVLPPKPQQYTFRHIFNFLKENMLKREKSDWMSKVRGALKKGRPISVALHLQTKRSVTYRGDENFMTHWTPLKDVEGKTE